MIVNIVDKRTNSYNVSCDAVLEPACNDNSIEGATKHINDVSWMIEELSDVLIVQAIEYGNNLEGSATLYLYDVGTNSVEYHEYPNKRKWVRSVIAWGFLLSGAFISITAADWRTALFGVIFAIMGAIG